MKKLLLSFFAAFAIFSMSANAQAKFYEKFAALDTVNQIWEKFSVDNGANALFVTQHAGPYILTLGKPSGLQITSLGYNEYDGIRIKFPSSLSLTASDTIFVRARILPGSGMDRAYMGIGLMDYKGEAPNNPQWNYTKVDHLLTTNFKVYKKVCKNWSAQYGDGGMTDNTKIDTLTLSFNNGYVTGTQQNWADTSVAFTGTIQIDYIQIGGSMPAPSTLDVAVIDAPVVAIAPNPATTSAKVSVSGATVVNVYDIVGYQVASIPAVGQSEVSVSVAGLADGLYIVSVVAADGSSVNSKLIVKK